MLWVCFGQESKVSLHLLSFQPGDKAPGLCVSFGIKGKALLPLVGRSVCLSVWQYGKGRGERKTTTTSETCTDKGLPRHLTNLFSIVTQFFIFFFPLPLFSPLLWSKSH